MARSRSDEIERGIFEKPKGSGIWWIRYANPKNKSGETKEKVGKRDAAITLYMKRKTQVLTGEKLPELNRKTWTIKALVAEYAETFAAKASAADYKRYGAFWAKELGERAADDIQPAEIAAWQRARVRAVKPSTVNRAHAYLKRLLNLAKRDRLINANAAALVPLLTENNARFRFLSPAEDAILESRLARRYWLMVLFALNTGLRLMEQLSLERVDLDFRTEMIRVRRGKGNKGRHVPMNATVKALLEEVLASHDHELVFPSRTGTKISKRNLQQRVFRKACQELPDPSDPTGKKKLGVPGATWHDLRHTYASRLVEAGVDLYVIKELLGHSSILMTQRYAHLRPDRLRAAVAVLVPSLE